MEKVKIKINGKTIQVDKEMNIIQASRLLDIEIPHFCYHEALSVVGNCRMCLVEIENQPKLVPACATQVQEGMNILTESDKVKEARRAVLELLLLNHPIDCPVCDQSGECKLQDYYMLYGLYDNRLRDNKIKKAKAKRIGPHIILDQERCVLCTSCIRYCKEIIKQYQLGLFQRGEHSYIDIYDNQSFDNMYSGNIADICPVGALTDLDFRFQCRVWFLNSIESICPNCSRGCNIYIHYQLNKKYLGNGKRLFRIKPRFNADVNKWWICDLGRYGLYFVDQKRIIHPKKKQNNDFIPISWNEVYFEIAQIINPIIKKNPDSFAIILSPHLTNEELFIYQEFISKIKCNNYHYSAISTNTYYDDFLIKSDKFPNINGAKLIIKSNNINSTEQILEKARQGAYKCLYIIGQDLIKAYGKEEIKNVFSKINIIIGQFSNENQTTPFVNYILPAATFAEKNGTFINFENRIQLIKRAFPPLENSKPDWQIIIELAKELEINLPYTNELEIWKKMKSSYADFSNLDYSKIGLKGIKLNHTD